MKKSEKDTKVHPKNETSQLIDGDGDDDYGIEVNGSEIDQAHDDPKSLKGAEIEQQGGDAIEEPEWKDKFIRVTIDKFMNSFYGDAIQKLIGVVSIVSSVAFVVMTGYDWSDSDPCCIIAPEFEELPEICPDTCSPLDCLVRCD